MLGAKNMDSSSAVMDEVVWRDQPTFFWSTRSCIFPLRSKSCATHDELSAKGYWSH